MQAQPFQINVAQSVLDDLRERLKRTRWMDEVEGAGWDYGTNLGYLKELAAYWQNSFDWRAQETKLNQFQHFRAEIDGFGVHFIHERGKGENSLPIVLTHGWPDSFFRFVKVIPLLTDPASYGGDPADSFHVIVPSIPGYGFSEIPRERGMNSRRTSELWYRLMTDVLGYTKFVAAGADIGSGITRFLALNHPEQMVGIHLCDVGYPSVTPDPSQLSEAEKQYLASVQGWVASEGAYGMLHRTKPETVGAGLNDSPVGLAAWIVEKFRAWSDCDGDVEKRFSKDELLTNLMIYWATETINSSMRMYYENRLIPPQDIGRYIEMPVGVAIFPKDLGRPPREWGERSLNVQRWTEMPRGGHFAALEEPELYAEDIRAFFRQFRG